MMRTHNRPSAGFTIVELLIVIVVIAILATISVVAYNGIQQRAANTARIRAAEDAVMLVRGYIAAEGKYPALTTYCIGTDFPSNECGSTDTTPNYTNAAFDTEIRRVGTLPKAILPTIQTDSYKALGPVYNYSAGRTINGDPHPVMILYWLDGSAQKCSIGNVVKNTGSNTYSTDNPSGYTYSFPSNATACYTAILDTP